MSAITAKASRKMKKYAVLTREPRCFLGSFDFSWEQRKVGDLLIERNQQAPMSDEYPLMAFIANEGVAPKGERYDRSALVTDTVNKLYKKTEKGDFIYSSNNLETGSIGLNKYGKACISPVYSIFEPTGIADSDFLGRRLVRKDFINAMVKWRQGVIYGQWRIHESDFLKIEITVPSVEEQRKIGAYLDQLDNLITLHQRKCVFLFGFFQAFISMIFTASTFSWEQRKFSDVVATRRGLTYKPSDIRKNGVRVLRSSNIAEDSFVLSDEDVFVVREAVNIDCVRANDILITAANGSSRLVGKHTIISGIPEESAVHGGFMLLGTTKEPHFVNASMGSSWYRRFIELFVAGGNGAIGNLNKNDLDNQDIAIPSEKEQKKIGSFFRQLDNLITLHQRECISFTARAGRRILTANKKRNTSSWEQRKFEEIAVRSSVICSDDTLPRVEYEDIVSGTGRLNKDIYAKQSIKSGIAFHQGDVLYGKLRPYLQNWLLPTFDGLAVGDFWVLQPQNADSSFLYRLIQSRQFDEVANQSTGTKMPRADWKLVSKTVFSIPSNISEQAAIGTYFTALDSLITLHQRQPFLHSTPEISLTVQLIHPFYTSSWEQRKLGELVDRVVRKNTNNESTLPLTISAQYGLVDQITYFNNRVASRDVSNYYLVLNGEFAYNKSTSDGYPFGAVKRLDLYEKGVLSTLYIVFAPKKEQQIDSDYLTVFFDTDRWHKGVAERAAEGARNHGLLNISAEDFFDIDLSVPKDIVEQKQIGAFIRQLDNLITLHQRKGKAAVTGCSNDANNSKGVYCKARDFGYKCCKKVESP